MNLENLSSWILSDDGLAEEFDALMRQSAAFNILKFDEIDKDLTEYKPDWNRLLFASSILSTSHEAKASEVALAVAQSGIQFSNERRVAEASATILTQLANHRAIRLAISRDKLDDEFEERLGFSEKMLLAKRELSQSLIPVSGPPITANRFQRSFWEELQNSAWISASAPTASGKTYLVLRWLLNEFHLKKATLSIFLAPTRALVGEIERQLLDLSLEQGISEIRIASLPLEQLGDRSRPTILVLTQERLHVFLNTLSSPPPIDILMVDEVHKIGDGLRGVILQDAIERVVRTSPKARLVFLSPLTENPETLIQDAPPELSTAVVPSDTSTVTQNLIVAEQVPRRSDRWQLQLRQNGNSEILGILNLHARPDTQRKRLSFVALAVGRHQTGTLVYANGADEAEKLSWQIFQGLDAPGDEIDLELKNLSDFARDTVHPRFQLVDLLRRGVAFHYGNMPTLLRTEIERLFKDGKIKFLVCTSTLVEGVNLACRTIVARGPRKGRGTPMGAHDFWNLAGRAGRWGQEFSGNIVCVDVNRANLWPNGVPERARYPIDRETDAVLSRESDVLEYLENRRKMSTAELDASLEQLTAYLLSWFAREGSFLTAPSASRLSVEYATAIDDRLRNLMSEIDLPTNVIAKHPGVSAVALQSLLDYFRKRKKPIEGLLPAPPESDDSYSLLIAIFHRINRHVSQAFYPGNAIPIHALVTTEWMRGFPLGIIIRNRIRYLEEKNITYSFASVIRNTMRDVEEVARFRAPKFLSAYLDVLKFYLDEVGESDLLPEGLRFDLFLEFGVATQTLLSLIGIGLSRTSAVALNEYISNDSMSEEDVLDWLQQSGWQSFDLPVIVVREIEILIDRRIRLRTG